MFTLRSTLLPLLLLLTSGSTVHSRHNAAPGVLEARNYDDLTPDQLRKIDGLLELGEPECITTCSSEAYNQTTNYIPRCAVTDDTKHEEPEDVRNSWSCLCTDKPFLEGLFSCFVKECSSNTTDFDMVFSIQYGMCKVYADIILPSPKVFLNDLCLLDDLPKGASIPTAVSLLKQIWPDYTFAKDFPKKTATTWVPTGTPDLPYTSEYSEPAWTCTPTPLADEEDSSGSSAPVPTGSSNITGKGNSTITRDQGAAGNWKEGSGIMGMGAVAAAVAGLAIFL